MKRRLLGLTDLILCEGLKGVRDPDVFLQVHDELLRFHVFLTGGVELATEAARDYRVLRANRLYRPKNH